MSLSLKSRQAGGYTILETAGQIEAGASCLQFHEFAKELIAGGARRFVLDLASVSYIDSAGLGLLLSIYATLRIQGGDLRLLHVGAPVREALTITNLLQIFQIFEDERLATGL